MRIDDEKIQPKAQGLEEWHEDIQQENNVIDWVKKHDEEKLEEFEVTSSVGDTEVLRQQAAFWIHLWTQQVIYRATR